MDEKPPLFTLHTTDEGDWITVDYWPDKTIIGDRFMKQANPAYVKRSGDEITIRCANGEATYRIVDLDIAWLGFRVEAVRRATWPVGKKPAYA